MKLIKEFSEACVIRVNTPELRAKLRRIGYTEAQCGFGESYIPIDNLSMICTNMFSSGYYMGANGVWNDVLFDCGFNEDLFLALSALRNDTENNQWYICVRGCMSYNKIHHKGDWLFFSNKLISKYYWRKANKEEIINHFGIVQ